MKWPLIEAETAGRASVADSNERATMTTRFIRDEGKCQCLNRVTPYDVLNPDENTR
jgi:hypothetical protein